MPAGDAGARYFKLDQPRLIVGTKTVLFICNSEKIAAHRSGVPVIGAGLAGFCGLHIDDKVHQAHIL